MAKNCRKTAILPNSGCYPVWFCHFYQRIRIWPLDVPLGTLCSKQKKPGEQLRYAETVWCTACSHGGTRVWGGGTRYGYGVWVWVWVGMGYRYRGMGPVQGQYTANTASTGPVHASTANKQPITANTANMQPITANTANMQPNWLKDSQNGCKLTKRQPKWLQNDYKTAKMAAKWLQNR